MDDRDREPGVRRAVLVVCGAQAVLLAVVLADTIAGGPLPPLFDFPAFYAGWSLVAHGGGAGLYDPAVIGAVERALVGDQYAAGVLPFLHPPHAALALAPLGLLGFQASYAVWMLIQGVALLTLVARTRALLMAAGVEAGAEAAVLVLAFPPVWMSLWLAQVSVLMLLALVELLISLERGRGALAVALPLFALTVKPQLLVFPLLLVILRRRHAGLVLFGALVAASAVVTAAAFGPSIWTDFFSSGRRVLGAFGTRGFTPTSMNNLRGLLAALLGDTRGAAVNAIALGALGAAVLAFAWRARRHRGAAPPERALATGWALWLGAFLSPHLFVQDDVFYLAAMLYLGPLAGSSATPGWRLAVTATPLAYAMLGIATLAAGSPPFRPTLLVPLALGAGLTWLSLRTRVPARMPTGIVR